MTAGGFAALRSKEIRGPALGCWISLDGFSAFPAECAQKSARPRARRVGNHAANPSIVRFKHELEFYFLPRSNVVPRSIPNTSCREQDITSINRITYERACEHVQMYGLTRNRRTTCRPGKITKWSIPLRHHLPFGTSTSAPRGSRASACVPRGGVIFGWQ